MLALKHTETNTTDPDEARDLVSGVFCHHDLRPEPGRVAMSLRADQLGSLTIVHLDYGAPVRIRPRPLEDFYLVQVPRSGAAEIQQNGAKIISSPQTASLLSPVGEVDMEWAQGTPQLCVSLRREVVEREASLLLGQPLDEPLVFDLGMNLTDTGNASWLRSALFLVDELRSGTSIAMRSEIVDNFTSMLAGQLLMSQPHNYTERIGAGTPVPASQVQHAVDYIEANLGDDLLSVPRVAQSIGISVRSMQEAFRKELGVTPVAYIKNRRMLIAHRRLLAGDPGVTTVTRIAMGVGIAHLGRFSVEYRQRFGEPPSVTLARRPSELSGAR